MTRNPELIVIILNWNGTHDTIECLKSVKNTIYDNYRTVLVDNGSTPESFTELKNWCNQNYNNVIYYNRIDAENGGFIEKEKLFEKLPSDDKLVIIENHENLGFASGNNVALKYALKINIEYALLLNNDTVIEPQSISSIMTFLLHKSEYVAVTPQIRYFEPKTKIWNCGGKIVLNRTRKYFYANNSISQIKELIPFDITFITGCALFFKPLETGILSEKFFFGEEDFEFSLRLKKQRKKMACVPQSVIYHKVGSSINKTSHQINKSYIFYLNRLVNLKSYTNKIIWYLSLPLYVLFASLNVVRLNGSFKWFSLFKGLIIDSIRLNRLDKATFETIMTKKLV